MGLGAEWRHGGGKAASRNGAGDGINEVGWEVGARWGCFFGVQRERETFNVQLSTFNFQWCELSAVGWRSREVGMDFDVDEPKTRHVARLLSG